MARHQVVPHLTAGQIGSFKRDGYVILPGAVDPDLCSGLLDESWQEEPFCALSVCQTYPVVCDCVCHHPRPWIVPTRCMA